LEEEVQKIEKQVESANDAKKGGKNEMIAAKNTVWGRG